jgi:hypothetical protein
VVETASNAGASLGRSASRVVQHTARVQVLEESLAGAGVALARVKEARKELFEAAREAGLRDVLPVLQRAYPHLEPVRWNIELRRYGLENPLVGSVAPPRDCERTLAQDAKDWAERVGALLPR